MKIFISFNNGSGIWKASSFDIPPKSMVGSTQIIMVGGYYHQSNDCCSFAFGYNSAGITSMSCSLNGSAGYNPYFSVIYR